MMESATDWITIVARGRVLERLRQQLEVADDIEWKVISERINRVMELQRYIGNFGGPGGVPEGLGAGLTSRDVTAWNGADRSTGVDAEGSGSAPGISGNPGGDGPNRIVNPESEALRQALDNNASVAELKAKLEQLIYEREQKQAELQEAQESLRQLLSLRQEALATMAGLL
jgi:hypothetical protein